MKVLYPDIEPFRTHQIKRGIHQIYVEQCGNPDGLPVLFLHGGPGSGCKRDHRCFFDPERYHIILFDQRGAGRSAPVGEIEQNTTTELLGDIEIIRKQLKIRRWLLFGGSWGATLALLYGAAHSGSVRGLILRGAFLARMRDLDWFIGDGVRRIYPDRWAHFLASIPEPERDDILPALHKRLMGTDELAQRRTAREWALWSGQVVLGNAFDPVTINEHVSAETVHQTRIELHYAMNRYFIDDNAVLSGCAKLRKLPAIIVHGRRDLVCPVESSYLLHQALPNSDLRILPKAGHIAAGDDMIDALVTATDEMADFLTNGDD